MRRSIGDTIHINNNLYRCGVIYPPPPQSTTRRRLVSYTQEIWQRSSIAEEVQLFLTEAGSSVDVYYNIVSFNISNLLFTLPPPPLSPLKSHADFSKYCCVECG